ncbi:DUF1707 SHOCT-like domain-containing protein [Streptomyces sp. NBC_00344]|uniref:DUF1707 SHOCT-like domain-containing protein n=1 Tax=Streptomyces sp. NBC_00344 TaxID=2975720 RepID=UPI002E1C913A
MTADDPERTARRGIRVSDAEREAVVEQLRDAAAEGRIDLGELDTRLALALTARTYGDLAPLTVDLPPVVAPVLAPPIVLKGGMHGASRSGRWEVPVRITLHGGVGGAKLDFTRTDCRLPEVEIEVHGEMAGVTIVIPDGWVAETDGVDPGIGGMKDRTTADRLPGTPVIRLTGDGGMAGVVIRHPNFRERRKLNRTGTGQ